MAVVPDVDLAYLRDLICEAKAEGVAEVALHVINQLFEAKSYPKAPQAKPQPQPKPRSIDVRGGRGQRSATHGAHR